ncbi:MAG: Pycsar system effector family protein [Segetibacter sp.]
MNYELLIKETETFITKYMRKRDNPELLFHNLPQTEHVLTVINQLAKNYALKEEDVFIVEAAGWFLYVGYYKEVRHPDEASAKLAEEFFKDAGVETETIELIKKCIFSATNTAAPDTLLGQIMYDANSAYIGTDNFFRDNKLKRKESEMVYGRRINKNEWNSNTIQMLESHEFSTDYMSRLDAKKKKNLEKLRRKIPVPSFVPNAVTSMPEGKNDMAEKKMKAHKENMADRTIETMFRTTASNSQRLSSQADTKAHIMISVNSIIISVLLGIVVRKMDEYNHLTIPVIMLLLVNLVTIIFSILATRPNVKKPNFSQEDITQNKVNLLFFGNFFNMDFDDYSTSMLHLMGDKQVLYVTMLRNLYEQGLVLSKKYRMLKISYSVFMYGLVISVLAFFIASKYL